MFEPIKFIINKNHKKINFDGLGIAVIDFKQNKIEQLECTITDSEIIYHEPKYIYDLASLTKILTNSLTYFLHSQVFDERLITLLEHRAGLPAWGILSRFDWREQIQAYSIDVNSETLYSDFSALRVMLDFEEITQLSQKEICSKKWDSGVKFWKDLTSEDKMKCLQTGMRLSKPIVGEVHDPNAFVIGSFCSHAGLFSDLTSLSQTLLNIYQIQDFTNMMQKNLKSYPHRFFRGFDRVLNPGDSLAGFGCSRSTAGHLGFTGQSIWIDFEKEIGHIILSNTTKNYWFEKETLNLLRRQIGATIWRNS
jgi:hypothetical protein